VQRETSKGAIWERCLEHEEGNAGGGNDTDRTSGLLRNLWSRVRRESLWNVKGSRLTPAPVLDVEEALELAVSVAVSVSVASAPELVDSVCVADSVTVAVSDFVVRVLTMAELPEVTVVKAALSVPVAVGTEPVRVTEIVPLRVV
jgi:hypothetical protein